METEHSQIYHGYIKALTDISRAITSDLYIEDLLKLIVMVTAKVTGVEICSLWLGIPRMQLMRRSITGTFLPR